MNRKRVQFDNPKQKNDQSSKEFRTDLIINKTGSLEHIGMD